MFEKLELALKLISLSKKIKSYPLGYHNQTDRKQIAAETRN